MACDAKDAVVGLAGVEQVVVELDDHHDSELINAGLAEDAGYTGALGHEAEQDLEELRLTFRCTAHTAALELCVTQLLRDRPSRTQEGLTAVRRGDRPTAS